MRAAGAITRPGIKKQEEQPHECDQCELVEKQMRHHGNAPSYRCERGALYLAFGAKQLSAAAWYTTHVWSYREYVWLPVHTDPVLTKQMDERIARLLPPALQGQPRGRTQAPPVETVEAHEKEAASLPKAA